MSEPEFHVYRSTDEKTGTVRHFLSVLPQELLGDHALPAEAIVGEVKDPDRVTPETLTPNQVFKAFLQWVIAKHASDNPELQEEARKQGHGDIHLVDRRTAQGPAQVPSEDVFGTFEVQDGTVQRYRINPNHALITEHGLFELDPWFRQRLLDEIQAVLKRA